METNLKRLTLKARTGLCALTMLGSLLTTSCEKDEVVPVYDEPSFKLSTKSVSLNISSATADDSHSSYPASNAIDGSTSRSDRWAGYGVPNNLSLDLGSVNSVDYVKIAFDRGDSRVATFEVWARESSSDTWTRIGKKSSNGTTTDFETFDLTNADARYVRLKCWGTDVDDWNNILEVEVWGTASGDTPSSSDYPADVLGISEDTWKINSFVGDPDNSPSYYDDITNASGISYNTYSDPDYFYTDGEWVFFKCYRGLGGSENSDNPRVELREMDGNGDEEYWTNEGTNSMTYTARVDQLSNSADNNSGVTCVGQIHGPGDSVDDVIRVQFYGEPGQTSGDVRLKIGGYIAEDVLGGSVFVDNGYKLDTEYTFKIEYNSDDYVTVYCDGDKIFSEKMDVDKDENYFKVGNYVQSSKGASYDGSYCLVAIKDLTIVHTN